MEGNFAQKHIVLLKVISLVERMLHAVQKEELRAHLLVRIHPEDFKAAYEERFPDRITYVYDRGKNSLRYRFIVMGLPVIADEEAPRL